ncbi:Tetratricopeptide-like helical domain superfamily [Sesbania bispinosa]|nr:Tetratricopeptide-like helical domain superfamily [Sesbania bispinosa]
MVPMPPPHLTTSQFPVSEEEGKESLHGGSDGGQANKLYQMTINLAEICTLAEYSTRPLDTIYSNFIDALPVKNEMAGGMHFHEAVKIKSSLPGAYLNLGNVYKGFFKKLLHAINMLFRHGQTMKNEMAGGMHFLEAVKIKSSFPGAYLNLGNMYKALGIPQEAIARYQHALQRWPYYGMAYGFFGVVINHVKNNRSNSERSPLFTCD